MPIHPGIAPSFPRSCAGCETGVASNDQIKDMACRSSLAKLERRDYITLPPRHPFAGKGKCSLSVPNIPHETAAIDTDLGALVSLQINLLRQTSSEAEGIQTIWGSSSVCSPRYHYLGFRSTVSENIKYIVFD